MTAKEVKRGKAKKRVMKISISNPTPGTNVPYLHLPAPLLRPIRTLLHHTHIHAHINLHPPTLRNKFI